MDLERRFEQWLIGSRWTWLLSAVPITAFVLFWWWIDP